MQKLSKIESWLVGGLMAIWCSHLIGVFTPEVGFDAVWYHLPVIAAIIKAGRLVYIPELYQSVNPLFSDLFFGIGFVVARELGAKIVAYLFGLALLFVSYKLARQVLTRQWALLSILVISTFQVVAWQSSSFYVDVAKAMWEVAALWILLIWQQQKNRKFLLLAALLFGASLGTKLFSLLLIPVWLLMIGMVDRKNWIKNVSLFLVVTLLIPLPFYLFSFYHTGTPWFAFDQHLGKIGEIGQDTTLMSHLWIRTLQLPQVWYELLFARDYTSILLIIFSPLVACYSSHLIKNKQLMLLLIWSVAQIGLWWYLPPLSTRYGLSGFITGILIVFWAVQRFAKIHVTWPLCLTIALAIAINMVPRLAVNYRSMKYILGYQTQEQYIRQFFDGHIDQHLKKWYQLP